MLFIKKKKKDCQDLTLDLLPHSEVGGAGCGVVGLWRVGSGAEDDGEWLWRRSLLVWQVDARGGSELGVRRRQGRMQFMTRVGTCPPSNF